MGLGIPCWISEVGYPSGINTWKRSDGITYAKSPFELFSHLYYSFCLYQRLIRDSQKEVGGVLM